jgi:hypothetical protein
MTWAAPLAGLLALAVVLPLVAHLWSRRRPAPMPFPTLRFLRAASPVSRRLHRVQDWPLLLLRLAIVGAVATAAAGPTMVTAARQRAWQQRLHRVIVVDERVRAGADDELARLTREATTTRVLDHDEAIGLLPDASSDAARVARSQRAEIVVIWDGTRPTLAKADLAAIPREVGLRLRAVAAATVPAAQFASPEGDDLPVEIVPAAVDAGARRDLLATLHAMRIAMSDVPIRIFWPGAPGAPVSGQPDAVDTRMLGALDALGDDVRLRDAAARSLPDVRGRTAVPDAARVLARAADGTPLLHAWWGGRGLVLALHASPTSPLALWSSVAACEAVSRPARWSASLPGQSWTREDIAAVERDASLPLARALPGGLDTRAWWGAVLVLLLAEQWWRRDRPRDAIEVGATPAASMAHESSDAA